MPQYIAGTAFFAAGAGLYIEDPSAPWPVFPFGGVMFVGHNLDAEEPYLERVRTGRSHGDPRSPMRTWRNLYALLDGAGVDRHECFFTNVYVGLIAGSKPTGSFPGANDPAFRAWCDVFLRRQIARMRPRAIVALGKPAREFLGWSDGDVGVVDIDGHPSERVCLAHPSMYPANLRTRGGLAAEIARLAAVAHG